MHRLVGQTHAKLHWLALMACLVVLAGSGCGAVAGAGTRSGDSEGASVIVTRMTTATSPVGGDHHLTVSVSCASGEQMVAGGYAVVGVFESDYSLLATYPSADQTWTVSTDSGSTYTLQSLVYCLSASQSLGIQRLQAPSCPPGTVHLSSGFHGAIPLGGNTGTPYVLCASRGVTPTAQGFRVGTTELDCASQTTGDSQSESRTFSYTCMAVRAPA